MATCAIVRDFRGGVLIAALFSAACGSTMQMSSEDLNRLTPTEGIVIGSVLIKGGTDVLGRTGWTLLAQRVRGPLSSLAPPELGYSLNASRGGTEEVFVAKMEAGDYQFSQLSQQGFSTFTADMNVKFGVQAAKNVYVGRLIVEFPPGVLMAGARFRTKIEDVKESTLTAARQKSGLSLGDVVTDLMN
jgi:hypothetical protein